MRAILRGAAPLLAALLLTGCVGLQEYDRKAEEAAGLRQNLDAAQARIASLSHDVQNLRQQLQQKQLENEELTQSLSMSRRYSQQTESRMADLRAQVSSQKQESETSQEKIARLEKELQESLQKMRQLEGTVTETRTRLARFEDRVRLQAQLEKDIEAQLAAEIKAGTVQVKREGERVVVQVASGILFAPGSVNIKKPGEKTLSKVAGALKRYANREIQVRGHTDNLRITDRLAERWETNWELSAGRATRVMRYLVEVGNLDPRHTSAAGFGEFRPIADNSTPEGREKNRRIEIVVFPPGA